MKASLPAKAPDAYGRKPETTEHKGEQRCYRHDIACFGKRTSIVGSPRCLRNSRDIGSFRFIGSLRVVGSLRPLLSEGGHARNRVVFINTGRGRGKKRALPESCDVADLALCLRPFAAAKCEWREAPGESPPGASR